MNKYIVTVFTDFEKREYSAITNSWVDPQLNEIVETMGYVLVDELGGLILPDYITGTWPTFLKRHGLRKIRFHDLRHPYVKL